MIYIYDFSILIIFLPKTYALTSQNYPELKRDYLFFINIIKSIFQSESNIEIKCFRLSFWIEQLLPPSSMRNIRTLIIFHFSPFIAPLSLLSCFHLQSNVRRCSLTHTCVRPEGDFTWRFPVFVRDMTISPLLHQWRKHSEKSKLRF